MLWPYALAHVGLHQIYIKGSVVRITFHRLHIPLQPTEGSLVRRFSSGGEIVKGIGSWWSRHSDGSLLWLLVSRKGGRCLTLLLWIACRCSCTRIVHSKEITGSTPSTLHAIAVDNGSMHIQQRGSRCGCMNGRIQKVMH